MKQTFFCFRKTEKFRGGLVEGPPGGARRDDLIYFFCKKDFFFVYGEFRGRLVGGMLRMAIIFFLKKHFILFSENKKV